MTRAAPWLLCALLGAAGQEIFRSGAERVVVDVRVAAQGRPVVGLDASSFEVRDNGVLQSIDMMAEKDASLDVYLLADVGGANGELDPARFWPELKRTAAMLKPDDRLAVWSLSNTVLETRGLLDAASFAPAKPVGGGTPPVFDGIALALMSPSDSARRRIVVVVTNGLDVTSVSKTRLAQLAAMSDAPVFVIFKQSWGFDPLLGEIAQQSGGAVIKAGAFTDGMTQIMAELRSAYVLSYSPTSHEPGWHPVQVRVPMNTKLTLLHRRGYVR